jgi:ribose transport system ATP-binding protein
VVAIAGITGSGREHAIGLISGQLPSSAGSVDVAGVLIPPFAPHRAKAARLASVPGDRLTQGIVPFMSVTQNLTLSDVARHAKGGRLRHRSETGEALSWIDRLKVRTASHAVPISTLSGGNQQKVLFARSLRMEPVVLTLDEPTRGVDVGAKEEIHQLVDQAAAQGAAVVVASTDTDEIVRLAHRVLIMRDGRVAAVLTGDQINVPTIEHAQLHTQEVEAS